MSDFKQFEQADFTTDYLGDGVRYRLPRRQLGRVRYLGWVLVLFGLFLTLFSIVWLSGTVAALQDQLAKGGVGLWMAILFCGIGVVILGQALVVLLGGLAVLRNRTRCEIEVRGGTIRVKERFYFFRLKRKRAVPDIRRLRIVTAGEAMSAKQKHDTRAWLGDFDAALMAETGATKKLPIAVAYPRDLLVRLAEELAPRLEAEWDLDTATIPRASAATFAGKSVQPKITVVEGPSDEDEDEQDESSEMLAAAVQPAGSTATIERRDYGITIEIPPVGLWKGSKGLFVFALIWNAMISIFLVVGVLGAIGAVKVEGDGPPWIILVFMIPFVAVGVGMTLAAINMGRRHATIATADDLMFIVRHSIFGKSTREWSANQLASIGCGNSGMEVNNVPVMELQIIPIDGKKFGCLSQLDNDELIWIAAELNQVLTIQRPTGETLATALVNRDSSGIGGSPASSRVAIEQTIDGLRVAVPPVGLRKYAPLLIIGGIFAATGIGIAISIGGSALRGGVKPSELFQLAIAAVFLLSLGGIGSAVVLAGLVSGRRQFRLTVEHDELTLLRRGPFLRKTFRWHRDNLESIDVTDSGTKVDDRTLYQVFIQSRKGDSVGIMTGHEVGDLTLVATTVKESLGLSESDPPRA